LEILDAVTADAEFDEVKAHIRDLEPEAGPINSGAGYAQPLSRRMNSLLDGLSHQFVEALVACCRCYDGRFMRLRVQPHIEPAGILTKRIDTFLSTHVEKDLERNAPFAEKAFDMLGERISTDVQAQKLATEHADLRV